MKSALPCHGIPQAVIRRLVSGALQRRPVTSRETWEEAVRYLFDEAMFRDERWAAIEIATRRPFRRWHGPDSLPLAAHLVTTGAWWDLVDPVSTGLVGSILLAHRPETTPILVGWATADDLWLRRSAIIAQLAHKTWTDPDLLSYALGQNLEGSRYGSEFFIRKAIGWALRQYGRTDPDWVRTFVDAHAARLSGLSRREALKHL